MDGATVICSACGRANKVGRRFCGGCASPLPTLCPACGTENEPDDRFCGNCAAELSVTVPSSGQTAQRDPVAERPASLEPVILRQSGAAPSLVPPTEERRLVTALFCDLVGFTPLSEALDPEEVRDIQAAYFSAMSAQIERYGGVVEKYAGDAVLALFGTPIAHEDDAERAVLCALSMQAAIEPVAAQARDRWEIEPAIRVGVNTGEVVSGTWDASGRQDVAVTGDAVNIAARLQSAADPRQILVGAETMRLTRRRIRYGERRDVTLKGKVAPVPVWPALGIREEFGERWEGYETPLVGRDREMVLLLDAWVRAQGGEGQLLTIVGDAGVGKSRLIAEFLGTLASSSAVRVIRARSLSYGQEISLWLIADLLRSLFGIREQETPADVAVKLRAAIPGLTQDETSRAEALDVLGEVLGLPIGESVVTRAGPQIRRQALIRSLRAVLGAVSERAPTVLVLEDLHWLDNASNEVLTDVLADVLGSRILVLVAQRPGRSSPWNEWGWPERLTLRPLGEREAASLGAAVLGGVPLSPELERHVSERAGGNPFFVEEMLRALEETAGLEQRDGHIHLALGAADKLPSTLTEVLLARLDRLESETKHTAQVASVIGRSFAVQLLAEVVGKAAQLLEDPLSQLQRAEIAFPRRNPELEYVFKHVSMRDVAYNTLVQKRRQELHLQTARAIAALYPSDEYVEMIAYHYGHTQAPEAAEWLERAGDRAAAVYANEEAIDHYKDAIRRLEGQSAEQQVLARLEESLGSVLHTAGLYDEALEHLGHAAQSARDQRDLEAAGRITALMGMAHRYRGTPEEGIALVSPMIDLLDWSGPSEALAALHLALASLTFLVGRYREQQASAERSAEIARAIGNDRLLGEAEERRGVALYLLAAPAEGHQVIAGAIPLIEAGGDLAVLSRAFSNAGDAAKTAGDMETARRYIERAIEVAERVGNSDQTAFYLANLGDVLHILGEWSAASDVLERALTVSQENPVLGSFNALQVAGKHAMYMGNLEEALQLLGDGLAAATAARDSFGREYVETCLAELDMMRGNPEAAVARLRPLIEAEDASLGLLLPLLAWALADVGELQEAATAAVRAVERTRGQEPLYLVEALRTQGIVLLRQGRNEEAMRVLDEGLEVARSLPYPYAEARILEQLGRTDEALSIFGRLGARKDIERLEQAVSAARAG